MLRNRHFLTGLGIGLVVAALLLQLMNAAANIEGPSSLQPLNDGLPLDDALDREQIEQIAQRKGLLVYTQQELDLMIDERLAQEMERLLKLEDDSEIPSNAHSETPSDKPTKIALYLSGGLNAEEIGHALHLSGVLDNQEKFLNEVKGRNLGSVIRAGYYEFDGPQDVDQILNQITGSRNQP